MSLKDLRRSRGREMRRQASEINSRKTKRSRSRAILKILMTRKSLMALKESNMTKTCLFIDLLLWPMEKIMLTFK